MKLTTRISLFFLTGLALVLRGMSASIYFLVRTHQLHQLNEQCTGALFDNACKYSAPGSPIQLTVERKDEKIFLAIEDDGCGIAEADVPHLFTPFCRSASARKKGMAGVGLGLSVVRRVAAIFGGQIELKSALGRGNRFTLILPVIDKPASSQQGRHSSTVQVHTLDSSNGIGIAEIRSES